MSTINNNTSDKKVSFMINKCCDYDKFCNDDYNSLDDKNNIENTNNNHKCSTSADSKPIVLYNHKYQRKSQPGFKRDYNNYYKNY